jgi:hypothetical protein
VEFELDKCAKVVLNILYFCFLSDNSVMYNYLETEEGKGIHDESMKEKLKYKLTLKPN